MLTISLGLFGGAGGRWGGGWFEGRYKRAVDLRKCIEKSHAIVADKVTGYASVFPYCCKGTEGWAGESRGGSWGALGCISCYTCRVAAACCATLSTALPWQLVTPVVYSLEGLWSRGTKLQCECRNTHAFWSMIANCALSTIPCQE